MDILPSLGVQKKSMLFLYYFPILTLMINICTTFTFFTWIIHCVHSSSDRHNYQFNHRYVYFHLAYSWLYSFCLYMYWDINMHYSLRAYQQNGLTLFGNLSLTESLHRSSTDPLVGHRRSYKTHLHRSQSYSLMHCQASWQMIHLAFLCCHTICIVH